MRRCYSPMLRDRHAAGRAARRTVRSTVMGSLATSPVHQRHVALGAKLANFSGWQMPIEYSGVIAEHTSVRSAVGLFDVSHLGKTSVRGEGAAEFVNSCLTNDLGKISPGKAQYTLCCTDSGGVVDDLIAYYHSPDEIFLVPNAANNAEVVRLLAHAAPERITVRNEHRDHGVLAVQGPRSPELLAALGLPYQHDYMSFTTGELAGAPVVVCRTGYTGEHGYEIVTGWDSAVAVWDTILAAGAPYGILPCGLGARDTLRTEMGYLLHGHELTLDISPVQARAGWAVGWKKPRFWGRTQLLAERERGAARTLYGLRSGGRGIPRPGMVVSAGSRPVGTITSGTFSPSLRTGIGLALIERAGGLSDGDEVSMDVRGRDCPMTLVTPPFVESHVR